MKTLVQAERYEACGQLCRLAIPIFEKQANHKVKFFQTTFLNHMFLGTHVNLC